MNFEIFPEISVTVREGSYLAGTASCFVTEGVLHDFYSAGHLRHLRPTQKYTHTFFTHTVTSNLGSSS